MTSTHKKSSGNAFTVKRRIFALGLMDEVDHGAGYPKTTTIPAFMGTTVVPQTTII